MNRYLEERIEYQNEENQERSALMSDAQFDQLERNLLRIDPDCDYFNKNNNLILSSLPKDQLREFLDSLLPSTRLLIEPKIVGCAIAIKYVDGKFNSSISRKGKDVSKKIQAVKDVPKEISVRSCLMVRGELFTPEKRSNYSQRISFGYLRSRNYQPNQEISFCAFQIINSNCNEYESLIYLRKLGFTIPEIVEANRTSQVEIFWKAWKSGKLFTYYPTDGLVVKINSRKLQLLREKSSRVYPFWQIAIKH